MNVNTPENEIAKQLAASIKEFEEMANKYTKQADKVQNVGKSVSPIAYILATGLALFVIELIVLGNIWAINEIANFF